MYCIQLTVCICVLLLLVLYIIRRRRSSSTPIDGRRYPVCLPSLPLVGSAPFMMSLSDMLHNRMMTALPAFFLTKSKLIGDVFACYFGSRYTVILNGRKTIQDAFVGKGLHFADRYPVYAEEHFVNINLNGIISNPYNKNNYAEWRDSVSSMLKELDFRRPIIRDRIQSELRCLIKAIDELKGRSFEPSDLLAQCIIRVLVATLFGRRFSDNDPLVMQTLPSLKASFKAFNPLFGSCPAIRFLPGFWNVLPNYQITCRRLLQLIDQEIAASLASGNGDNFVTKYVKLHGVNSAHSDRLAFAVRDVIGGGIHTLLTTLRWAMTLIANHREIQNRLHEEIADKLGNLDGLPSLDDMSRLPYVEATLLEVMRIETIAPLGIPRKTLCDTDVNGVFIPKDTLVMCNLYSVNMDPKEWREPHVFQPDRFLDEAGNVFGRDRIIPFSLGKRSCIGEQLARSEFFILLTGLLQSFEFRPPEGQSSIDVTHVVESTVAPSSFTIRLIRRQ